MNTLRKTTTIITTALLLAVATTSSALAADKAESKPLPLWGIEAGIGKITAANDGPDYQNFYTDHDEGNTFYLNGDYRLTQRLALTGGVSYSRMGMLTDMADGIGLRRTSRLGLQVGAKYYFLPLKWAIQPHVGAMVRTNVLNLGRQVGSARMTAEDGYPGAMLRLDYDQRGAALAVMPRLGVDVRLVSSVSLCLDYEWQWLAGGHDRYKVTMLSGDMAGRTTEAKISRLQPIVSAGLKVEFPMRSVSQHTWNSLASWIGAIIYGKAR